MKMPSSIPRWRQHDKYIKQHYDRFVVNLDYNDKESIKAIAQSHGVSINKYLCSCIYKAMQSNDYSLKNAEYPISTKGNYQFSLTVSKGEKAVIQDFAANNGESLNGFIKKVVHYAVAAEKGTTVEIPVTPNVENTSYVSELEIERQPRIKEYKAEQMITLNSGLKITMQEIAEHNGVSLNRFIRKSIHNVMNGSTDINIDSELIESKTSGGRIMYTLTLQKGEKEKIKEYAAYSNSSVNRFLNDVVKSAITKSIKPQLNIQNGVLIKYTGNEEHVDIPEGVKSIFSLAFLGCTNLKSVTLPESLQTIARHAFSSCESLKNITLPAGVTKIGEGAFEGCTNLKSASIPAGCNCDITAFPRTCNVTRRSSEPQRTREMKV